MSLSILLPALTAFATAALLTRRFCDPGSRLHLLDHPNERSLHVRPTPRTGGVAILAGLTLAVLLWMATNAVSVGLGWLVAGTGLVAVLSFLDDRRSLPVSGRILGHVLAAGAVVGGGGWQLSGLTLPTMDIVLPEWLGMTLSVLFLVWMTNLYNFMDGMDGFAGGMAVFGFGALAVLGGLAGNMPFLSVSLLVAAASAGFLPLNFPPARIFMGDTGSAALGLLAGGLCLWGDSAGVFDLWIGLLVFSPFIVDATLTLLRRMLRGERVWEAHRAHYYQRLVRLGWGHRKTVLWEYALMAACATTAWWAVRQSPATQWWVLGGWAAAYAVLVSWVSFLERRAHRRA